MVAVAMLVVVQSSAPATVVVAKNFDALCAEADLIFVGSVVGSRSAWTEGVPRRIETTVTFRVERWIKGSAGETIDLRFGGGEVGEVREVIGGMPTFRAGQKVVLFAREEFSINPIVGFHQGCFSVRGAGENAFVSNVNGRPVVGLRGSSLDIGSVEDLSSALRLDDFVDLIRQRMERDQ